MAGGRRETGGAAGDMLGAMTRNSRPGPWPGGVLIVVVALLVRADMAGDRSLVYLLKPLATLIVIVVAWLGTRPEPYRTWVLLGLGASLTGDVFLMLPQDLFVAGLAAFLVAHLCYLRAFTRDGGFSGVLATGVPLLALGIGLGTVLWPGLGGLKVPVACYIAVILAMAWQALERWRLGSHAGARAAGIGALFFVASDATLGVSRFRADFAGATAVILGTYYAAQWFIAGSVARRAS